MGVDAVGSLLARRKADARRAVRLHAVAAMVAITLDRRYYFVDAAAARRARGSGARTALAAARSCHWSRAFSPR